MPNPNERRTRPYDSRDRDRLDQRPKPIVMRNPGMGNRVGGFMVFVQGDMGRTFKLIGALLILFISATRFASVASVYLVIPAAILALITTWLSLRGSLSRFHFVRINEFADPTPFRRQLKFMHALEIVVAVAWLIWLGASFGPFDWALVGFAFVVLLWALMKRRDLNKMFQPRNVWER